MVRFLLLFLLVGLGQVSSAGTRKLVDLARGRQASTTGRGKAIRLAAGITVREMAQAVGVDVASVFRWEAGEVRPRGANAVAWARVLEDLEREMGRR